jgi:hypothetical protein
MWQWVVMKTSTQIQYNKYMGDHYYLTYPFSWKTVKWYELIWYSIVEVTFVYERIAYILEIPEKKVAHRKFQEALIYGLVRGFERKKDVRFPLFVDLRLTV